MGKLYKSVLGKASGKVGDVVFRIINGKVYIASHIGSNKISKSPACVNNRKRFAAVQNYASAVINIPDLKIIWNKSRNEAKSGYNKVISVNTEYMLSSKLTTKNVITPDGFGLRNTCAVLSKDKVTVGFNMKDILPKYSDDTYNACFVLTFSDPIGKKLKTSLSISDFVPDVIPSDVETTEVSLSFNKSQKTFFKNYNNVIVYFSLTNVLHNKPKYSKSYSFEFSLNEK